MDIKENRAFTDLNGSSMASGESGRRPEKPQSGCYVSTAKGFILTFFALTIAVLIGVIVHFASPRGTFECKCSYPEMPTKTEEQQWMECLALSVIRKECLDSPYCAPMNPTTTQPPTTTDPPLPTDVRLPLKVMPTHYDLELKPDIYTGDTDTFTFSGKVDITIKCQEATDVITLHINKLEIDGDVELHDAGPSSNVPAVSTWEKDMDRQFLLVKLGGMLTVGQTYILSMSFHGPLKDDLHGLYWSSYETGDPAETRYLATTQLQPTDARKTFPCFDEPGIKSTFSTTLLRKSNMKTLSNMDIDTTEDRDDDWKADIYNPTVKMSTYLLAFIVCDFEFTESVTATGTKFRVWSRPDAVDQTNYALEKGVETIEYFENYFNISFPLPKQDMIAVPDFAAGAMENWGLIIYRETALLYDELRSSAGNKQRVAEVVVHELAHQWFGNLLTPVWWDDLWLNEGFASYMEYVGMDQIEPTWNIHDQFIERDLHRVFLIDSLSTSHPIWIPVNHPDEINEIFDRISYLKGASIIRMMDFFLGESTFKKGLTNYLNAYAYGNANHTDLWNYLGQQAVEDNQDIDVGMIMNTWVRQMGYPLVTIDLSANPPKVTQQHFLTDPNTPPVDDKFPSPYSYKWTVPLTIAQSTSTPEKWENPTLVWMQYTDEQNALANLDSGADWLIGNVGQYGYYRVSYNMENWNALIDQLNLDHTKIPVKNRAQIVDDSINLGRSGYLDQLVGLKTTEYLIQETEYVPWKTAYDVLAYFDRMLRYTEYYGAFQGYMLKQVLPLYNSKGYDYDQKTEPHLEKYKRSLAWTVACRYGEQTCLEQASVAFQQWTNYPDNDTLIKPDMKSVIYCNGIRNGGVNEWNFLYNIYKHTNLAAEADRILWALTCSNEPWILNRFLYYAIDSKEVRRQDALGVIADVSSTVIGRNIAWDFFRAQWPFIYETWGSGFFAISNLISSVTQSFNTEFHLAEMRDFRAQYPNMGAGNRAFEQAIESVTNNINWMEANRDKLGEWLISKNEI